MSVRGGLDNVTRYQYGMLGGNVAEMRVDDRFCLQVVFQDPVMRSWPRHLRFLIDWPLLHRDEQRRHRKSGEDQKG